MQRRHLSFTQATQGYRIVLVFLFLIVVTMLSSTVTAATGFPTDTLTVNLQGRGFVTSQPLGIQCGLSFGVVENDCVIEFLDHSYVTLIPSAEPFSSFSEWKGDCDPGGRFFFCNVYMDGPKTVTAIFDDDTAAKACSVAAIAKPPTGGTVTGSGPLVCDRLGTVTETPTPGHAFTGWYDEFGVLVSTSPIYTLPVTSNLLLEARFMQLAPGLPLWPLRTFVATCPEGYYAISSSWKATPLDGLNIASNYLVDTNTVEIQAFWANVVGGSLTPLVQCAQTPVIQIQGEEGGSPVLAPTFSLTGSITTPPEGTAVPRTFPVGGSIERLPPDSSLWLFVEIDGLVWPKEPAPSVQGTSWHTLVTEGGTGTPLNGFFVLSLYMVDPEGNQAIKDWLDYGRQTGSYPGLAGIAGGQRLATVNLLLDESAPSSSCPNGFLVQVPARPKDYSQNIFTAMPLGQIPQGSTLSFTAVGQWSIGLGWVTADGSPTYQCAIGECPVAGAPIGGLIVQIGEGMPVFIGSQASIIAVDSGTLWLGSNDNTGPCDGSNQGSCYADNEGQIDLCVEVVLP